MSKPSWWMEHWPVALWVIAVMQTVLAYFAWVGR